ncbi:ubiquitin carboxyl-terminal hydrolase [Copidosoma floridanum]|uniref:ubiquitin carboxyl-terminal hydrolase n=1 Tax=Copidosoma floridanum TaxID=29053 RepID=UPI0006C9DC89|nr:ubiquitin carboxyl-terminal hydrolase [Copidosoma floridanum]
MARNVRCPVTCFCLLLPGLFHRSQSEFSDFCREKHFAYFCKKMEISGKKVTWIPLESNPEVMTKFVHKLGVPDKWSLCDVYGLDQELLAALPQPVLAIILLFPVSLESETNKSELEAKEKETDAARDKVYHLIQYIRNACGTIALIHSIANNLDQIKLQDGELKNFLYETKDVASNERGERLLEAKGISDIHKEVAGLGQTEVPESGKVFHHFVAFVHKEGSIYELDGGKPHPVNHGSSSAETFLEDAARVCREYMNRDPENVQFNIIALARNE